MTDCMSCLVRLAQGCPTNGLGFRDPSSGITHACVTVEGPYFNGRRSMSIHALRYSDAIEGWMTPRGEELAWPARNQT